MTPVELLCTMILFLAGTFTGVVSGTRSVGEELLYSSFRTVFAKTELHPHLTIRIALEKTLLQLLFKEKKSTLRFEEILKIYSERLAL